MRKLKHEEIPRRSPAEVKVLPKHPVVVVLDNVRSLYNVGSILRTSDAALIDTLFLTGITGTPDHRGVHKTALGAQDTVNWAYEKDPVEVVSRLRERGYTIAVLEITDEPTPTSAVTQVHFPLCLIVGNEVSGVREELVALADLALEIPQYGAKQSLNVAVAYGIAVFDLIDRYRAFQHVAFNGAK
ncbi:MAG: TrmH family RNA methyltransferase [Rhodothermales bacterium]